MAVTLQCASNRRDEIKTIKDIPGEAPWSDNAISHGVWTGVRLADVLAKAGVDRTWAKYVEFTGHDHSAKFDHPFFGGSVPLSKAVAPETLVAYELDGEPLPPVHGFPLRTIVPGYVGALSQMAQGDQRARSPIQKPLPDRGVPPASGQHHPDLD